MAQTLQLEVQGMTCDHCVRSVTNAIKTVPGVTDVTVSLQGASAIVGGNGIDVAKVVAAVAEEGYEAAPR